MNIRRIIRLLKKELLQTRRDKRMMAIIFAAPILQLLIFGYAATTDINHIALAVLDQDRTRQSRELVANFTASGYFEYRHYLSDDAEIDRLLDGGKAQIVLRIPPGFARDIAAGRTARVQTILDGSDSVSAGIIGGYANEVIRDYSAGILTQRMHKLQGVAGRLPALDERIRVWYNPELKSVNYMVPGVLCMILMIVTIMLTAFAIVKEKEIGTLEQLVVTPITAMELMVGKTLPFLIIGYIDMTLVLLAAMFWFHVTVAGSLPLLFLLSGLFLLSCLGIGIFISTVSKTQQEALLSSFMVFLPFIMLSGFMFPVENMPPVVQWITYAIPLRYFLEIIRGIFLKGNGLELLWPQVVVLAVFGVGILTLSAARFSKRLG